MHRRWPARGERDIRPHRRGPSAPAGTVWPEGEWHQERHRSPAVSLRPHGQTTHGGGRRRTVSDPTIQSAETDRRGGARAPGRCLPGTDRLHPAGAAGHRSAGTVALPGLVASLEHAEDGSRRPYPPRSGLRASPDGTGLTTHGPSGFRLHTVSRGAPTATCATAYRETACGTRQSTSSGASSAAATRSAAARPSCEPSRPSVTARYTEGASFGFGRAVAPGLPVIGAAREPPGSAPGSGACG